MERDENMVEKALKASEGKEKRLERDPRDVINKGNIIRPLIQGLNDGGYKARTFGRVGENAINSFQWILLARWLC